MDAKTIEQVLKTIITSDQKMSDELSIIKDNIAERDKQIKGIRSETESSSNKTQTAHGKKLLERIQNETEQQKQQILDQCEKEIDEMDHKFDAYLSKMIEKAFSALTIDNWSQQEAMDHER